MTMMLMELALRDVMEFIGVYVHGDNTRFILLPPHRIHVGDENACLCMKIPVCK